MIESVKHEISIRAFKSNFEKVNKYIKQKENDGYTVEAITSESDANPYPSIVITLLKLEPFICNE